MRGAGSEGEKVGGGKWGEEEEEDEEEGEEGSYIGEVAGNVCLLVGWGASSAYLIS